MRQKREVNSFIILSISVERCATFYRSTKDMQSMSSMKYALLLVVSSIEHILFTQKLKTNWIPTTNYILLSIIFSEVNGTKVSFHDLTPFSFRKTTIKNFLPTLSTLLEDHNHSLFSNIDKRCILQIRQIIPAIIKRCTD